jgi:hypothetical protein
MQTKFAIYANEVSYHGLDRLAKNVNNRIRECHSGGYELVKSKVKIARAEAGYDIIVVTMWFEKEDELGF